MEELVRQYLVSKGYQKSANALVGEVRGQSASRHPGDPAGAIVGDQRVISALMSENSLLREELVISRYQNEDESWSRLYSEGYDRYFSWAMNALDVVKSDLLSVCFPLFVHSYMTLIRKEAYEDARNFWDIWHQHHKDLFAQELTELSMLTSRDQLAEDNSFLESNAFVKCASRNMFRVGISKFAFGLLTTFLAQNDLLMTAAIINDRIQFDISETSGSHSQSNGGTFGLQAKLVGYGSSHRSLLGQTYSGGGYGLSLGVPGKGQRRDGGFALHVPDYRNNETYRSWLEFIVLRDAFNHSYQTSGQAGGAFFGTRAHQQQQQEWRDSAGAGWSCCTYEPRAENLGDAALPSALFATLTNVNDSLICMHINRGVNQAVGGFRDNCVRVWDLGSHMNMNNSTGSGSGSKSDSNGHSPWNFEFVKPSGAGGAMYRPEAPYLPKQQQHQAHSNSGEHDEQADHNNLLELRGHSGPVYGVSQDKSSKLVLSGSADASIRLWNTSQPLQQCVGRYNAFGPVWDVSFGPLGYYFASANMDRTIGIYSTDRVSQVRLMTGHCSDATCVTWHDNGTLLASGSDDKSVRVWDLNTGSSVRLLAGSKAPITCVAISPVGDKLAAGAENGLVHIWDIGSGIHMAMLQGHVGPVYDVGFSSDGSHISTGGADCAVRVWDLTTAAPPLITAPHPPSPSREVAVLGPLHSFYTKFSPVFCVGYSPTDLITAGGPYNTLSSMGGGAVTNQKVTEEEVISALGLSSVKALGR